MLVLICECSGRVEHCQLKASRRVDPPSWHPVRVLRDLHLVVSLAKRRLFAICHGSVESVLL